MNDEIPREVYPMKRAIRFSIALLSVVTTMIVLSCGGKLLLLDVEEVVNSYQAQPDMMVKQDGRNITSGTGSHDFGACEMGRTIEADFIIQNLGNSNLILTGQPDYVQISGTDAASFSMVGNQPGSPVQSESGFQLRFSAESLGTKSAIITIPNNDPDAYQNPYVFTVTGTGAPEGTITYPNGGETFSPGSQCTIIWVPFEGAENVKIELNKGGVLNSTVVESTLDNGSFDWTIPSGQSGGDDYRIKIIGVEDPSLFDESDSNFAIGTITVSSPNGGESIETGSTTTISWSSLLGGSVKIELLAGGSLDSTIVSSTANDGSYSWSLSSDLYPDSDYRIRVSSLSNTDINDVSNNDFTISGWRSMGNVSSGGGADISATITPDDRPVIAFLDDTISYRLDVRRWNAVTSSWNSMGPVSDEGVNIASGTAIDVDNVGRATVMYRHNTSPRLPYVRQDYPTDWTDLNSPIDTAANNCSVIVVDGWYPHIAWDFGGLNVSKLAIDTWPPNYTTHWVSLGQATTSSTDDIKLLGNPLNTSQPYIAYTKWETSDKRCRVKKYAGSQTWTDYGYVSSGEGHYIDLATDDSDAQRRPFVVFSDNVNNERAHVKKWSSGTTWTDYGYVSSGPASHTVIECGSNGYPVVAYVDNSTPNSVQVTKWNGTNWISMGTPGNAMPSSIEILMPSDNLPFVTFVEYGQPYRIRVYKRFE